MENWSHIICSSRHDDGGGIDFHTTKLCEKQEKRRAGYCDLLKDTE